MPEVNQLYFNHREMVEVLLKHSNIHEGKWMILVQFGFGAGNMGPEPNDAHPTGMVAITRIGIQQAPADAPPNLVVDAALVNPATKPSPKKKKAGA